MSTTHLFQDFGTMKPAAVGKLSLTTEEIEDLKLQAFEDGYQAGWEDAVKAQDKSLTHVSAGLANSLQTASFEYHELRSTMNAAVQSIMAEVVQTILPAAARASLGAHIRDFVLAQARAAMDRRIEITVAPASEEAVRSLLSSDLPEPFEIATDPDMSPDLAMLRLGAGEVEMNLGKTVADITAAIETYFENQNTEVRDGRPS